MPDIFVDDNTGDEFVDDALDAYMGKPQSSMPSDAGTGFNRPLSQMTPERKLIEGLGFRFPEIERAKGYRSGEIMAGATKGPEYGMEYSSSPLPRLGGEVVRGATAPGRKLEQLFNYLKNKSGVSSPEQYQLDKARMAADEVAYQSKGNAQIPFIGQSPAELLGGASSMPNLNPGSLPSKILTERGMMQAGATLGKGALAGSIYGQLQPVENRSEDDFLPQNTGQGLAGMFAAPGVQLVGEKVVAPALKGVGRMLQIGKRSGIGDVRKLGGNLSDASKGMGDDVAELKRMSGSTVRGIPDRARELLAEAQNPASLSKSQRVRLSSQIQELKEKADVGTLYQERNQLADEIGAKVKNDKVRMAISQSLEDAKKGQDKLTASYIDEIYDRITNRKNKLYVGDKFKDWDSLRSVIGDEIRSHYSGKSTVTGAKGAASLQPIKKAITEAMDDSASIYGSGLSELTQEARLSKRAYQGKWQDPMSVQVHGKLPVQSGTLQYGDTPSDELVNKFAYQGEAHGQELGERAEKALGLFTDSGKAGVKSILFDAAKAKAKGDPTVFLSEMNQPGVRKFFDGKDLEALEGLKKIMAAAESAGKLSAGGLGAVVGNQVGGVFGHETAGGLGGLALGYSGDSVRGIPMPSKLLAKGWSKLLQSNAGQRLLLDAARGGNIDAIMAQLPKVLVSSQAAPNNDKLKTLLKGQK